MGSATTRLGLWKPDAGETTYVAPFGASMDILDLIPGKPAGTNAAGLTGATGATRYVGGTTSGAPASGTFAVGDYVITQNGHIFICTTAGSPGTWVDPVTLIDAWVPFTVPGTLTTTTNAFKIPVLSSGLVYDMKVTLGTAGSSTTTVSLLRNGSTAMFTTNPSLASGNAGPSTNAVASGSATVTTSQYFQVGVTAGTGAANLTGVIGIRRT